MTDRLYIRDVVRREQGVLARSRRDLKPLFSTSEVVADTCEAVAEAVIRGLRGNVSLARVESLTSTVIFLRFARRTIVLEFLALARRHWARKPDDHGRTLVLGESIEVPASVAPGFALGRLQPNPALGPLQVEFSLGHEAQVQLDVFDVTGRHVTNLVNGTISEGSHTATWTGLGRSAPGLYLVRYQFPGGAQTQRIMRIK